MWLKISKRSVRRWRGRMFEAIGRKRIGPDDAPCFLINESGVAFCKVDKRTGAYRGHLVHWNYPWRP